jgi:hypothetical protein
MQEHRRFFFSIWTSKKYPRHNIPGSVRIRFTTPESCLHSVCLLQLYTRLCPRPPIRSSSCRCSPTRLGTFDSSPTVPPLPLPAAAASYLSPFSSSIAKLTTLSSWIMASSRAPSPRTQHPSCSAVPSYYLLPFHSLLALVVSTDCSLWSYRPTARFFFLLSFYSPEPSLQTEGVALSTQIEVSPLLGKHHV